MKKVLSIDSLGELDDGAGKVAVNGAIAAAVADLEERGQDEKPRKVVITLVLAKTEGALIECHLQVVCKGPPYAPGA